MARKLRVQYPGAMYHLMNRGDRREPIFTDQEDPRRFLETLGQACEKTCWCTSMRYEAMEARAQRLLNEVLQRIGWSRDHLLARHKGDPHKVDIAQELRAHTTMPLSWIADNCTWAAGVTSLGCSSAQRPFRAPTPSASCQSETR